MVNNRKHTTAAKIFESMTAEDFKHSIVVTKTAKRLAWGLVIFINVYFVYFSVLRGITRSISWQMDYLMACIFQLIVEIFVYETVECVWIHFAIPKLVSEDVATTMKTVKQAINLAFRKEQVSPVLDSPKYFFVSRQLAEEFPQLFESSVVLAFQSYFPPSGLDASAIHGGNENVNDADEHFIANEVRVYGEKKTTLLMAFVKRFNFSVFFFTTLQQLGTTPIRLQQVIIHTLQPILFSFVIILYLYMVKYPVVALAPTALIFYEIFSYFHRSRYSVKKPIPAINDAAKNLSSMNAFIVKTVGDGDAGLDVSGGVTAHIKNHNQCGKVRSFLAKEEEEEVEDGDEKKKGVGSISKGIDDIDDMDLDSILDDEHEYSYDVDGGKDSNGLKYYSDSDDNGDVSFDKMDMGDFIRQVDDSDDDEMFIVNPREAVSFFEDDFFSADQDHDPYQGDKVMAQYKQCYDEADAALIHFLVHIKGENPEQFEYGCDETSDEYRYLYKPKIEPFVDKWGNMVNVFQIIAKRSEWMTRDREVFEEKKEQARLGIKRRRNAALVWDAYRLYDSKVILPFIDVTGQLISSSTIQDLRAKRESAEGEGVMGGSDKKEKTAIPFSLSALYEAKQLAEFNLMNYKAEVNLLKDEKLVGHKFLAAYRRNTLLK